METKSLGKERPKLLLSTYCVQNMALGRGYKQGSSKDSTGSGRAASDLISDMHGPRSPAGPDTRSQLYPSLSLPDGDSGPRLTGLLGA